eukprot:NODE_72_length_23514_cov_0.560624.p8 type:complete len:284 gc:universal NODE_72_length_23514_cov_0.560624:7958-7107(-)
MSFKFPISCFPISAPGEFKFSFVDQSQNTHSMFFDYSDLDKIGESGYLICSKEATKRGLCKNDKIGSFIRGKTTSIPLVGDQEVSVLKSGYKCLIHEAKHEPIISLVNQNLYIPAPYIPLYKYCYLMSLLYFILAVVFTINYFKNSAKKNSTKLNIMILVWISMLEMRTAFEYYIYWGTKGSISPMLLYIFALLSSIKYTLCLSTFHATCKKTLKGFHFYLLMFALSSSTYFYFLLKSPDSESFLWAIIPLAIASSVIINHIITYAKQHLKSLIRIMSNLVLI